MNATQKITKIQNGYWTIIDGETDKHRTFRIWTETWTDKKKVDAEGKPLKTEVRVVGLLTGSCNKKDYTNFATVSADGEKVFVWKRFKGKDGKMNKWQLYGWLLQDLFDKGAKWGERFTKEGHGHCYVCNRLLTNPESISSGIGPVCQGK